MESAQSIMSQEDFIMIKAICKIDGCLLWTKKQKEKGGIKYQPVCWLHLNTLHITQACIRNPGV